MRWTRFLAVTAFGVTCAVFHAWAVEPYFDCNNNGVEDSVDIAMGASADANNNGIPDECERERMPGRASLGNRLEVSPNPD